MRSKDVQRTSMWTTVSTEELVPLDHPLRDIRAMVNAALRELSPVFEAVYSPFGRPSIAPEKQLRGWDKDYEILPAGPSRDWNKELARRKARLEIYDVAAEGVLVIDQKGVSHIVNPSPSLDLQRVFKVVVSVFEALTK